MQSIDYQNKHMHFFTTL